MPDIALHAQRDIGLVKGLTGGGGVLAVDLVIRNKAGAGILIRINRSVAANRDTLRCTLGFGVKNWAALAAQMVRYIQRDVFLTACPDGGVIGGDTARRTFSGKEAAGTGAGILTTGTTRRLSRSWPGGFGQARAGILTLSCPGLSLRCGQVIGSRQIIGCGQLLPGSLDVG